MEWDVNEMLKKIDDYFDNVTQEEFEKALENAGYGLIEPASKSGYELIKTNNK